MICPKCGTRAYSVADKRDDYDANVTTRRRWCGNAVCGARWNTTESMDKGQLIAFTPRAQSIVRRVSPASAMRRAQQVVPQETQQTVKEDHNGQCDQPQQTVFDEHNRQWETTQQTVPMIISGSDPIRSLSSGSLRSPSGGDQGVDPARVKRRRTVETPGFKAWWIEYPRKVAKEAAMKAWEKLALEAKATEVIAGLRHQLAYFAAQPIDKVPHPASWLNAGRWTDDPAAYRIAAVNGGLNRDTRCQWHRDHRHDATPSAFPKPACERCKHFSSRNRGRQAEPEHVAGALPAWSTAPPPAPWTAEQRAEAESLMKQRKANGGAV